MKDVMNDDKKQQLMKLLGIADIATADKVVQYAELVKNPSPDYKKNAAKLMDALKASNYIIAKELNERIASIISAVASAYQEHGFGASEAETDQLNKYYILIAHELEQLYSRNDELKNIEVTPAWKYISIIEGDEWQINQYVYQEHNDAGYQHIAQVKKLCIIAGAVEPLKSPKFLQQLKLIEEADKAISDYRDKIDTITNKKKADSKDWFIPVYRLTYNLDGSILINDVLKLKSAHAGSASDKLMEQAIKNDGVVFTPDIGKTARNISTILSSKGFSGTLRQLFFPKVSNDKGVLFRSTITRETADKERIDTMEFDLKLEKLGAEVKHQGISLDEIPF